MLLKLTLLLLLSNKISLLKIPAFLLTWQNIYSNFIVGKLIIDQLEWNRLLNKIKIFNTIDV